MDSDTCMPGVQKTQTSCCQTEPVRPMRGCTNNISAHITKIGLLRRSGIIGKYAPQQVEEGREYALHSTQLGRFGGGFDRQSIE